MEALHLQQTILNKEILDHVVSKIAQGQAQDAVIENLLGIGVAVVTRVQSSQDVDFVKKEAQKIVTAFEGVVYNLQEELMTKVGETANQFFNPDLETSHTKKFSESLNKVVGDFSKEILPVIKTVNELAKEKFEGFDKRVSEAQDKLNPDLEGSYFGKMRNFISQVDQGLATQLDDSKVGSFAYRLKEETEKLFGKDSPIIATVSAVIDERTKGFERELIQLRESIAKSEGLEEGLQAAMDKSPAKGRKFEEDLMEQLQELAKPFNDIVEYTGDLSADGSLSKKGDFIYKFASGPAILIEAKDSDKIGVPKALRYLTEAMTSRVLNFSILVHKSEAQLPRQVDCMGFYEDDKIITSTEYLRFALQWARIFIAKAEDKMADGINETLVLQRITDIMSKLKQVRSMKSTLSIMRKNVDNSCDKVATGIDEMKNDITIYLNDIENEFIKLEGSNGNTDRQKRA